jgi:tubulin-specific chaperone C
MLLICIVFYPQSVKALQDKLNETITKTNPKPRFQFKKSTKTTHVDMSAPENDPRLHPGTFSPNYKPPKEEASLTVSTTSAVEGDEGVDTVPELPPSPKQTKNYNEEMAKSSSSSIRKPSFSASRSIGIANQNGLHIILPSSAARATAAGSLTELKNCVVDMSVPTAGGTPFPGLAIKNISGSLLVAGRVMGPAHITGVSDSIIVVTARQVRIHECHNVDMYLHCGSRPIIEDCSGMRFAPLPASYVSRSQ